MLYQGPEGSSTRGKPVFRSGQCSSHLYRSKPWIQTFWSNCSCTQCWPTTPEYLFACGRCSIKDQKVPQHVENRFCH